MQIQIFTALFAFLLSFASAFCDTSQAYAAKDGTALEGFDIVTFFDKEGPQKGSPNHLLQHEGLAWQFANERNRRLFRRNPEKYLPQYKGFCGWALKEGRLVPGIPSYWTVTNGKLYLSCSQEALDRWEADLESNIRKADEAWEKAKNKF